MGILPKMQAAMERRGMSAHSVNAYAGYIGNLWRWKRRVAPNVRSLRDVTDSQWVSIFDRLRTVDQYAPGSLSGHMCALKFLFEHVYREPLRQIEGLALPPRVDNVRLLPHGAELAAIFEGVRGVPRVVLSVILGSGSRIEETCKFRIHHVDLIGGLIMVKRGKANKDRWIPLSSSLIAPLKKYFAWRRLLWESDCQAGFGEVEVSNALSRKYRAAPKEWEWQWLFPSQDLHPESGRWYISPGTVQRVMRQARKSAGIHRIITPHHLRHYHAHALKNSGVDTADIAMILGHADIETTRRYTHADDVRRLRLPDVAAQILPTSAAI